MLAYSVCSRASFEHLQQAYVEQWVPQHLQQPLERVPCVVVGNKTDIADERREVTPKEGKRLAKRTGAPFFEVSAKEGRMVRGAVEAAVVMVLWHRRRTAMEQKKKNCMMM